MCIREVKYLIWDHLRFNTPMLFHNAWLSSFLKVLYFDKCRKYTHLKAYMFFQLKRYAKRIPSVYIFIYYTLWHFWLSIILLTVHSQRGWRNSPEGKTCHSRYTRSPELGLSTSPTLMSTHGSGRSTWSAAKRNAVVSLELWVKHRPSVGLWGHLTDF